MEDLGMPKSEHSFGRSKLFIRSPRSLFDLEDKRKTRNIELLIRIQAIFRGWMKRALYQKMRKSQATIAARYKGFRARREYLKQRNAAILIASYVRMWKDRKPWLARKRAEREAIEAIARAEAEEKARKARFEAETRAAVILAAFVRGWLVRKRTRALFRFELWE
jgi:myosin-1